MNRIIQLDGGLEGEFLLVCQYNRELILLTDTAKVIVAVHRWDIVRVRYVAVGGADLGGDGGEELGGGNMHKVDRNQNNRRGVFGKFFHICFLITTIIISVRAVTG